MKDTMARMKMMGQSINKLGSWLMTILLAACSIGLVAKLMDAQLMAGGGENISIVMPDIRPDHAEQYLCMSHRVKEDANGQYIVGFNPQSDAHRVHHMLLYGCERPGIFQRDSPNFVWDCSEMHANSPSDSPVGQKLDTSFEQAPICQSGKQQILYGWALNAPALILPQNVGFKIGSPDSNIEFLVLQVHYGHYDMFEKMPSLTDNSGLILNLRPNTEHSGIIRRAGVLLLFSLGYVPQGINKHEIWCEIQDEIEIHPFRFRVHTHKLGTRVKGVKIGQHQSNNLDNNVEETSLIGAGDPQEPQMFYPVHDSSMTLSKGDKVYATCEFNNNRGHIVEIGQTGDDEMCNFYMMYWTNSTNLLTESQCSSVNPPRSYLKSLFERILS